MIVEIISTFIAALALIVSVWTIVWTRKNDIRSVRPCVEIYQHFWGNTNEIQIANIGLGPAKIKKFEYSVDGKPVKNVHEALSYAGLDEVYSKILFTRTFGPGYMIANNTNQTLIGIDSKKLDDGDVLSDKVEGLKAALKKISINIVYESMHEELPPCKWEYDRHA